MKRLLALVLAVVAPLPDEAAAELAKQFRAEQIVIAGGQSLPGTLHVDQGSARHELRIPGAPPVITILNAAKGLLWMLMPGNVYSEQPAASAKELVLRPWLDASVIEPVGSEESGGEILTVHRVAGTPALILYVREADGAPVRMASEDGSVRIEWSNVQLGPQDAALFELPEGARPLVLPPGFGGAASP